MLRLVFGRTAVVEKRFNRSRKCAIRSYMDSATPSTNSYRRSRPATSTGTSPSSGTSAALGDKHTFVSSHYRFDDEHVERFLARRNIHFQLYGDSLKMQCPWCPPDRNRSSYRLVISKENGSFSCSSCGMNGSWFDLQKKIAPPPTEGGRPTATVDPRKVATISGQRTSAMRANASAIAAADNNAKALPEQDKLTKHTENLKKLPQCVEYLTETKKIEPATYEKYKVGACVLRINEVVTKGPNAGEKRTTDHNCLTFPWLDYTRGGKEVLARVKTRSIDSEKIVRLDPQVGRAGFFGWHLISKEAKVIIITEDEFDAMAVYQATGEPAVALSSGASSLPVELVDKLERFDQIYLWLHDNVASQEMGKKWADKLGRERVFLVPSKPSKAVATALGENAPNMEATSAWQAYVGGADVTQLIKSAKPLPHEEILTFKDLREEVYRELAHPEQVAGVPSLTFPTLNTILRGHRRGELTVFTGPTGIGKTTILGQMSLDYLRQGVSTLWGSFEINNVRLAKKMITQFAERSLEGEDSMEDYDTYADKFSSLPLHFMRFHGNTGLEAVFDAMEYAVYVNDVEHIILDNLQFMTPTHLVKGFDKFDILDMAIARLRKFATSKNIHITIIIHPRKEDDGATLSTASVFGTAKATQEADNVIILQKGKHYRYLEVTKNRFSGDLGRVPFRFDPATLKFSELSQEEVQMLEAGKGQAAAPTHIHSDASETDMPPPEIQMETIAAAPRKRAKKITHSPSKVIEIDADARPVEASAPAEASTTPSPSVEETTTADPTTTALFESAAHGSDNLGFDRSSLEKVVDAASPDAPWTQKEEDEDEKRRLREKAEQANLSSNVLLAGEAAASAAKEL